MNCANFLSGLRNLHKKLMVWMLLSIALGISVGLLMSKFGRYSDRAIMLINFPSDLFLRMIKCIALPLLSACLISAVGSLDRSLSVRLLIQFMICNIALKTECAFLGYFGSYPFSFVRYSVSESQQNATKIKATLIDNYLDLLRNIFTENYVGMFISSCETVLHNPNNVSKNDMFALNVFDSVKFGSSPNMMGIVAVSIIIGFSINTVGKSAEKLLITVKQFSKSQFLIMKWIIIVSPAFLVFMMMGQILKTDIVNLASDLALYLVAVILLYDIQMFCMYPILYFIIVRKNPFQLYSVKVIITALSTGSSLATLPFAIEFLEDECHLEQKMVRFILPLGVNISKDGSAIFFPLATHFVIFMENIKFEVERVVNLIILSVAGSLAVPGVPFGAMAVLLMVWEGVHIETGKHYGTVLSIEWLRDRISTVINVYNNCFICAVLCHYNRKWLQELKTAEGTEEGNEGVEEKEKQEEGNVKTD